jgi:hypothetical protein
VIVILEHIDYLLKQEGKKSPYGFAAYSISHLHHMIKQEKYGCQKMSLLYYLEVSKGMRAYMRDLTKERLGNVVIGE